MIKCPFCGEDAPESARYCGNCGAPLRERETTSRGASEEWKAEADRRAEAERRAQAEQMAANNKAQQYGSFEADSAADRRIYTGGVSPRSIAVSVILSLVTCGLFLLYWEARINDDVNTLSGETGATSGGMVVVLTIITCGIYQLFWLYKMGERCDRIKGAVNASTPILYLLLGIFTSVLIPICLMQDTVNSHA